MVNKVWRCDWNDGHYIEVSYWPEHDDLPNGWLTINDYQRCSTLWQRVASALSILFKGKVEWSQVCLNRETANEIAEEIRKVANLNA